MFRQHPDAVEKFDVMDKVAKASLESGFDYT